MTWLLWAALGAIALFALDRLLLGAEKRGLVYWRRRRGSATARTNAFQSIQSILEPAVEHVVEERESSELDEAADDDPDELPPGHAAR